MNSSDWYKEYYSVSGDVNNFIATNPSYSEGCVRYVFLKDCVESILYDRIDTSLDDVPSSDRNKTRKDMEDKTKELDCELDNWLRSH